jgi:hypothetical protein
VNAVVERLESPRALIVLPFTFDWQQPDYVTVFRYRAQKLAELRQRPTEFAWLRNWYADHPAQFISDWGCTYDPRNIERNLPALMPFILFPKQVEWIDWALERWRASEPGLTEKSRDCGVSWLAMALSCHQCLYRPGMAIGFGSAKADKVDRTADPDALFFKGRYFLTHLPPELRGGWDENKHSAFMRLWFPKTRASITGEAGDNIGRGGRKAMYFVDEAAHLERPQLVESSLLSNTNCRLDLSSVAGMANPFAQKRHLGKVKFFTFHWRDDPRKSQAWYDKQVRETDSVALAQDIDINYMASQAGAVLPSEWVQAAVGAAEKLGYVPSGVKRGGLDIADQGPALNAFAGRHGSLLNHLSQWTGKNSDIYQTTVGAFNCCDDLGLDQFFYDGDGVGAGIRGDARVINEQRRHVGLVEITDNPFHGGAAVDDPEGNDHGGERTNKDFYLNLKAQSWWGVRRRLANTFRAVNGLAKDLGTVDQERNEYRSHDGLQVVDLEDCLFIDANIDSLGLLVMELVQPTYTRNSNGKILVDKAPEGAASPNLADAVMITFNPLLAMLDVWGKL